MRVLFICGKNQLRSPTAEQIFSEYERLKTDSAGVSNDADVLVSAEQIEWADVIFVMESAHRRKLTQKYPQKLHNKRIICLDIPDHYSYMQAELIALLKKKVTPHLGHLTKNLTEGHP